ncbi:rhodanese-like protein [Aureococcus anophagefferens]|uniref:Rhodanese-like protein n=1 Tax=Aureococcus anophagefferens TaxID=44056 RepID=A0ABR1GAW9_AURAN
MLSDPRGSSLGNDADMNTDASTDPYADEDRIERDLETLPSKAKGPALAALAAAVKASRASFDVDAAAFVALVVDGGLRCVDVRSPGEFARPRAGAVGTAYKRKGRAEAMSLGMSKLAKKGGLGALARARAAARARARRQRRVHCCGGGLRSGAVAWLLRRRGFDAVVLRGATGPTGPTCGRSGTRAPQPRLVVAGGRTGVGKTRARRARGRGAPGLGPRGPGEAPGLGLWLARAAADERGLREPLRLAWRGVADTSRDVFVEDEEGHVGTALVPPPLYELMRLAPVVLKIECAYETLGREPPRGLRRGRGRATPARSTAGSATRRARCRSASGDRTAEALALLDARDLAGYARLLLERYDKRTTSTKGGARARTRPCWTWTRRTPSTRAPSPRASSRRSTPTTPRGGGAARAPPAFDDAVDDGDKGGPPWCAPS